MTTAAPDPDSESTRLSVEGRRLGAAMPEVVIVYPLFERFGVELEYMIVDRETLDVRPLADQVLYAVGGAFESEVECGELSWSNELVLHVIELKTNGPRESLNGLAHFFQRDVRRINELLAPLGARLMPTAMHPWMDPLAETVLWPHAYNPVYAAFDRIFGCRGHGWSNLQALHLNLPFANDEEFGRLHAAVRLILPILPALAASSPVYEGRDGGLADARLGAYCNNALRIPSVTGSVIPERAFTRNDYERLILQPLYADIAPFDPEGILQYEWLNARGAIARFDRQTIEIRLLDMQECPQSDVAVLQLIVAVLKAMVSERWSDYQRQCLWEAAPLSAILRETIRHGDLAEIRDTDYLRMFGLSDVHPCRAGQIWQHLYDRVVGIPNESLDDGGSSSQSGSRAGLVRDGPLEIIFREGCLSRRIRQALGSNFGRARLAEVYAELCACLDEGRSFRA